MLLVYARSLASTYKKRVPVNKLSSPQALCNNEKTRSYARMLRWDSEEKSKSPKKLVPKLL